MIHLEILGGDVKQLSDLEKKTIALDGVVQGPVIDHKNQIYSFDHHGTVQRLCTTSTAKQVLDSLLLGFDPDGYTVLINHADLDSVLSVYLLQNPQLVHSRAIVELVRDVNDYDVHGPAYPVASKRKIQLYEEPFEKLQEKNKVNDVAALRKVVEGTMKRLDGFVGRHGGEDSTKDEDPADSIDFPGYRIEYIGESGWVLARKIAFEEAPHGYNPILELYKKGYEKVVLYHELDGRRKVTIAKKSDFIDFPLGPGDVPSSILFKLDDLEKGWGGGSTIGGSPRESGGSSLPIQKICSIVDNAVRKSRKEKKSLSTPEEITLLVNDAEERLPVPEKVMKNIALAFALEPIPDKRGCTTRYSDLKPTITLEMLTSAAVNSSVAYLHLARYCLEHQTVKGSYQYLFEAMTFSKWGRGGGKTNQGMLEFTVPIVAAQMVYDPRAEKNPLRLLEKTSLYLKETSERDVEYLIETKKRGNVFSNVQDKYPVNEHHGVNNVYRYYAKELSEEKGKGYGTGIVHNRQFVRGFPDVALMLRVFNNSTEEKFSERVNEAYERMLEFQQYKPIGKGLAADLIASMLYLAFTYSKGELIVK